MSAILPELKDVVEALKCALRRAGLKYRSVGGSGPCAALLLPASGTKVVIEWKRLVNDAVLLSSGVHGQATPRSIRVIATKILSQRAFSRCVESGQCVMDSVGNGLIDIPGFRFERFVETEQPRRPSVSGTPFTARASRIVRALLAEPSREWSQSELVDATGVTQGYASKCLKMLVHHSYVVLSGSRCHLQAPDSLLDDWSAHYRFDRHHLSRFALSSQSYDDGLGIIGSRLRGAGIRYAYTGWSGAHLRAPYATPPKTMAFVESIPGEAEKLGLFPVEEKENVLLVVPNDEGVFQFTQDIKGLVVASDAQIYIDLNRLSGRAKEQADTLRNRHMNRKGLGDA